MSCPRRKQIYILKNQLSSQSDLASDETLVISTTFTRSIEPCLSCVSDRLPSIRGRMEDDYDIITLATAIDDQGKLCY
nr:hypothetical protein [Tanacetum cinerariifolium]